MASQFPFPAAVGFQNPSISEQLDKLGEPLRTGGSVINVLLIIAGICVLLFVAYGLGKLQERLRKPVVHDEPTALFHDLLLRLHLPRPLRRILQDMAHAPPLKHPAVLLLSEASFDRHAQSWLRQHRPPNPSGASAEAQCMQIRSILFPPS